MKCVEITAHGTDIDRLLRMSNSRPKPIRKKGEILVRVAACALAPGDVRVMKGHCDYVQSPGSFPYIPGGDLCGCVEEVGDDDDASNPSRFRVGDCVMAMFELPRPLNGLAEYAVVKESHAEIKPSSVSAVDASALPSSAQTALVAVKSFVKRGHRVLVLGGSGGVGTFFVQLARNVGGASFIAATSTDEPLLKSLGVDRAINYKKENWWEVSEFVNEPFDVIFDTVGGRDPWTKAMTTKTIKNGWHGGRYIVMNGDEPLMRIHNAWDIVKFGLKLAWRSLWTAMWPFVPRYVWHNEGLDLKAGILKELANLVDDGKLKVVHDPMSPIPFEIEDVKKAFRLMESRHAHGKVVVQISSPSSPESSSS